jgi:hypothetical protein
MSKFNACRNESKAKILNREFCSLFLPAERLPAGLTGLATRAGQAGKLPIYLAPREQFL